MPRLFSNAGGHSPALAQLNSTILGTFGLVMGAVGILTAFASLFTLYDGEAQTARTLRIFAPFLAGLALIGAWVAVRFYQRLGVGFSLIFVITLIFVLAFPIGLRVGIHAQSLTVLALVILLAGLVYGPSEAKVLTVMSVSIVSLLYIAELFGWLGFSTPRDRVTAPVMRFLNFIALFMGTGWLISAYSSLFRQTLARLEVTNRQLSAALIDSLLSEGERKLAQESLRHSEAETHQRLREIEGLAGALATAERRIRRDVAKVLHDDVQQLLVSAKFQTVMIGSAVPAAGAAVQVMQDLLGQCLETTRSLCTQVMPAVLRQGDLSLALQWLAQSMAKSGLAVKCACAALQPLPQDQLELLFEVTRELLFNVVKHAKVKEATLTVSRPAGRLEVVVSDAGIGFDPHRPLPPDDVGGLGLVSIRERLLAFGGALNITSALGQGSRLTLSIPMPETANATGSLASAPAALVSQASDSTTKFLVLLVDDHAVLREGLRRLVNANADLEVVGVARNGQQAVELARTLRPDVVVMDINMPVMNGVEATRLIVGESTQVRVLGLSMHDDPAILESMRAAGASACLNKGGCSDHLIDAIRELLDKTAP